MNIKRKVIYFSFILIMYLSSCKVESVDFAPAGTEKITEETIGKLKVYFSNLVNVDIKKISYNETSEIFSVGGIDQVTLQDLTKYYENSKVQDND